MPEAVKPPKPPSGTYLAIDRDDNLVVSDGWKNWKIPARTATVHTSDHTGKRVTVTRVVALGIFALAAKKKTGELTVIIAGKDGDTRTLKVRPKKADAVIDWAVAFNTWSAAQT